MNIVLSIKRGNCARPLAIFTDNTIVFLYGHLAAISVYGLVGNSMANYQGSGRVEVFTAVTMRNGVFWDVTPCGFCKNRRFGVT
jgi:hypothetical protein